MVTVKISGMGQGCCALTNREAEGLTVAFDNDSPLFLSHRSFRQILALRLGQNGKPPQAPTAVIPRPMPAANEAK